MAGINRSRQYHRASACMCQAPPAPERRAGLQVLRDDVLPHDRGAAALHEHHHAEPDRPGVPRPAPPRRQSALLHPPCWQPSVGEAHGKTGLSMSRGGGLGQPRGNSCRAARRPSRATSSRRSAAASRSARLRRSIWPAVSRIPPWPRFRPRSATPWPPLRGLATTYARRRQLVRRRHSLYPSLYPSSGPAARRSGTRLAPDPRWRILLLRL